MLPRAPVMPASAAAAVGPPRLRLLCLHGFRTSGAIMKEQLEIARLDRDLSDLAELVTVDAPHLATGPVPSDVPWPPPHYEWWNAVEVENNNNGEESSGKRSDDDRGREIRSSKVKTFVYQGFEETLQHIASVLDKQGPFDGFLAFSQGTILASLLLAAWSKADEARERERREEEEEGRRASSSSSSGASTSSSSDAPRPASASAAPLVLPPRLAGLRPGSRPRFAVLISGVWAKAPICSALEREEDSGEGGTGARWTRRESGSGSGSGGSSEDGTGEHQPGPDASKNNSGCIRAPSLHVIGRRDYVAPLSRRLASAFRNSVVLEHPGGHVVPRLPAVDLATLRAFLASQQQASASSL